MSVVYPHFQSLTVVLTLLQIGRRPVFLISFFFYMVWSTLARIRVNSENYRIFQGFQIGCALSRNTASILVFRFLAGTFAAAPLTNSGYLLSAW